MRDIIITGVPRSGTTLAAAILDQAPDCFCLSEPEEHVALMQRSRSGNDFVDRLEEAFSSTRAVLFAGGAVTDRREPTGRPVTNYYAAKTHARRRQPAFTVRPVSRPGLSSEFRLGIKHNALYTAVLPEIARRKRFKIIVIVRNPTDVIASWESLDLPVSRGELPAADRYWPEMHQLTKSNTPLLEKQMLMYELMCRRFLDLRERVAIVRYEDMVQRPELLLEAAGISGVRAEHPSAIKIQKPLHGRTIGERGKILMQAGQLPATQKLYGPLIS
jgi:hypothetical protein